MPEDSFQIAPAYICPMNDLKIGIVQPDLRWEDRNLNLERMETLIRSMRDSPDLVVIPEMFTTGFSMRPELLAEKMDGPSVSWMRRMSSELGFTLAGSLMIEEDGAYYNRLVWMHPDGRYETYDKRHLFRLAGEHEHYRSGKQRRIAEVKGWRVNLNICFDLRFPVWSRQATTPGNERLEFDLMVYVANWPERRSGAWRTLLPARAIENQCYVIGVNRVGVDGMGIRHIGDSMVVDPQGNPLFVATDREIVQTQTLEWSPLEEYRSRFPFWVDADPFHLD